MDGISKERLLELLNKDASPNFHRALKWLLRNECTELYPWIPVDENTPRDRPLLMMWPELGVMQGEWVVDRWYCDMWELTGSLVSRQPTHYKELQKISCYAGCD